MLVLVMRFLITGPFRVPGQKLTARCRFPVDVERDQPDCHPGGNDQDDAVPIGPLALGSVQHEQGKDGFSGRRGALDNPAIYDSQTATIAGKGIEPDQTLHVPDARSTRFMSPACFAFPDRHITIARRESIPLCA